MKKSLMFAFPAMALMAACTSNEVNEIMENQEITFQVANFSAQTKANVDYDAKYKDVDFGTYAWFYEDGQAFDPSSDAAQGQTFMDNEKVSHDDEESKSAWKPSMTYYWPKSGSIDFISYSPYKNNNNNTGYTTTINQKSVKFEGFVNENEDLMYADKAVGQKANSETYIHKGVPTLFRHALAKINFKVNQSKLTDASDKEPGQEGYTTWTIAVSEIAVMGIQNEGSAEFTLNAGEWQKPTGNVWTWKHAGKRDFFDREGENVAGFSQAIWKNEDEVEAEGKTITGQVLTLDAAYLNAGEDNESSNFFVMPQYLKTTAQKAYNPNKIDSQTIKVTYSIITLQPNGEVTVENKTVSTCPALISGNSGLSAWEINKNITYTITIDPTSLEPITFDPAVADWEDVYTYPIIRM